MSCIEFFEKLCRTFDNIIYKKEHDTTKLLYLKGRFHVIGYTFHDYKNDNMDKIIKTKNAYWWSQRTKDVDEDMGEYLFKKFNIKFFGSDEELIKLTIDYLNDYVIEQRKKEDG